MPSPPDYPHCLEHLLYRKMWSSTLGEVQNTLKSDPETKFFMKPSQETKAFSGGIYTLDDIEGFINGIPDVPEYPAWGESLAIHCSELVQMIAEYRVYVVKGDIRAICQYIGSSDAVLDKSVVEKAVKSLGESEESR